MKRIVIYLALRCLLASPAVLADVDEALIEELRMQIAALTERVGQLETQGATPKVAPTSVAAPATPDIPVTPISKAGVAWADKMTLTGDFRYRYEDIEAQDVGSRDRNRIRARLALKAKVTDSINFNLGLASGGDDPVSTNQTLGKAASTKEFRLDIASMDWKISENSKLLAGKMKNPFFMPNKSFMLWDGDYRPEGLAAKFDNGAIFVTTAYHFLESDNKAGRQETGGISGLQVGYRTRLGEDSSLTLGAGYFDIGVAGKSQFLKSSGLGNTLDDSNRFVYDYQDLELFAELNSSFLDQPLVVYADFAKNQDADDEDTAWAVGAKLGKAKIPGTWELAYIFQDIEADAVYGLLNDSDFGSGMTDVKGHLLKAAYAFNEGATIGASYFINEVGEFSRNEKFDYDRLQVDVKFKF